ncbi:hypothetical protein D9M70_636310 [compost metagenome]
MAAKPLTAETVWVSARSTSVSLASTLPLTGLGKAALLVSSLTEKESTTASGPSFTPVTVSVSVVLMVFLFASTAV